MQSSLLPTRPRKGAAMCAVSLLSSRTALWPGVRHRGPWDSRFGRLEERMHGLIGNIAATALDVAYGMDSAFDAWFQRHEALGTALMMALMVAVVWTMAVFAGWMGGQ